MYGLIGKIESVEGARDDLTAILLEGMAGLPGCRSYVVANDPADPNSIWVTEVWDDAASHKAALTMVSVQEAIARGRPLIAGFSERHETEPTGGHGLANSKLGSADRGSDEAPRLHPATRVGHVHLKVADLQRAIDFYEGVLGFDLMQRLGDSAAFLSAGGYHHHVGLNTWESRGGSPPPPGTTGLFHAAFLYPTRAALAEALRRLVAHGIPLDGASDHGVSEALYLRDPDGNGLELYWDRPEAEWPQKSDGTLDMYTRALDLDALLAEAV